VTPGNEVEILADEVSKNVRARLTGGVAALTRPSPDLSAPTTRHDQQTEG
jgi:hypothetical protein